jgi:hypothetical protein
MLIGNSHGGLIMTFRSSFVPPALCHRSIKLGISISSDLCDHNLLQVYCANRLVWSQLNTAVTTYKWAPRGITSTLIFSLLRVYGLNSLNVSPAMPLMSPEDAFQVLNLSGKVTPDEIKHAYRIMVTVFFP